MVELRSIGNIFIVVGLAIPIMLATAHYLKAQGQGQWLAISSFIGTLGIGFYALSALKD